MGVIFGVLLVVIGIGIVLLIVLPIALLIGREIYGFVSDLAKEPLFKFVFSVAGALIGGAFLIVLGIVAMATSH